MLCSKKTAPGRDERLRVLDFYLAVSTLPKQPAGTAPDDVLDACAALVTAHRKLAETAFRIPTAPDLDTHGLRMEMWI